MGRPKKYNYPAGCNTPSEQLAYRRFVAVLNALFTGSTDNVPVCRDRVYKRRMTGNRLSFIAPLRQRGLDIAGLIPTIREGKELKIKNNAELTVKNQAVKHGAYSVKRKEYISKYRTLILSDELVILKTRMIEAEREYNQFRKQWAWKNYVDAQDTYWTELDRQKFTLPEPDKFWPKKKKQKKGPKKPMILPYNPLA